MQRRANEGAFAAAAVTGPRAEDLAIADADLTLAQICLQQAQATMERTTLRAPFAGDIGSVTATVGERVAAGEALVQLGDLAE